MLSPVSIQTQSWLLLLRPSIPIGWRLRLLREMIGCLPTQALAFHAVFVYATHSTQAIAFEWKLGFSYHLPGLPFIDT